ncbi:MAG: nitroreductase family protein [bacterium]|nr:nitroreductase family protein [bacterium]
MKNLNFNVDKEKCIHCGLCEKDCIGHVFGFDKDGFPVVKNENACISCQHCLSICPTGAISVFDKNPDESDKIYSQNPDMILNLIKSRRSQRLYKNENVSEEKIQKLKEMLKWIPTGCNYHKLHFSFIDDLEVMNEFREHVNNKIVSALTEKHVKAVVEKFSPFANAFINGEDIVFRGAPHLLVVANPVKAPCAKEDVIIALSYFELYANSLGLGTCWCGFGEIAMKLFPELSEYLEIPEGYQAGYVMLFGEKDVNYTRTTQPSEVSIVSAKKKGFEKVSFLQKAKRYFWNSIR